MRIVLANLALARPGGTETYLLTVAHELRRLGHEPVLHAEELGPLALEAERRALPVARTPAELPESCDAILSHDGCSSARMAARYPGTRLVHVLHSDLHDLQLPPLAPGAVSALVALSERFAARARALALDVPLVRLTQPVDTGRFFPAGSVAARPRTALLLSNALRHDRRAALVETWQAAGVRCLQVGEPGTLELDPVPSITQADIVVAKGRAALEGMACARPVYVYDAFGGDGWVTPESYPALEEDNFAGLSGRPPRTREQLARDLEQYDADMGIVNRELAVSHHGARRHVAQLVDVLREPGEGGRGRIGGQEVSALGEVARLTRTAWDAERRSVGLEREVERLTAQRHEAEARAEHAEARLRALRDSRRGKVVLAAGRLSDLVRRR